MYNKLTAFFPFIACFIAMNIATTSFAQTALELDPVTITSARSLQKTSETGRSISVVDGKMFNNLPVHSLDELLKYVPGIEMQNRGPMGSQGDIVIRGGTFQQVLVLLDGVKVNDPVTGHFNSYIPVAPYEIERIEILRGPAAAVYGAEAVGGVVNVITKNFNRFEKDKSLHGKASVSTGEYGFFKTDAGIRSTGKKINFSAGLLTNSVKGQLLRSGNRGFAYNQTYSASVAIQLNNDWQLSLRSSYDHRNFAAQNFYTTLLSDTATEKVNTFWNQLQVKQVKEKFSNQFDLLYKHTKDHYLYNPLSIANENKSNNFIFQYLRTQKINAAMSITGGAQLDRRSITSNDRGDHSTNHGALFGSLLYKVNKLHVSPSLRYDQDQNYGAAFLPQLSASYDLIKIIIRANAGRAIRSGDFTERYNNYNKPIVRGGSIGNPDLTAEKSWSYEAGTDVLISKYFKASVTGFYRDQQNVIDYVPTAYADIPRKDNLVPGGTYTLAKNIKEVRTRGIEMQLTYQQNFSKKQSLQVNTGLTLLHSKSSDSIPSFYIISHAKALVQGSIIYRIGNIGIVVNGLYKHRGSQLANAINASLTKDYFLLNAQADYSAKPWLRLFVAVNNATNITYSDLLGSRMPKRWTSFGISSSF